MKYLSIYFVLLFTHFNLPAQDDNEFLSRSEKNAKSNYYYETGLQLYSEGNYEESITYLDSAISLDLRRIDYYVTRAECYESVGNYVRALADYETVLKIDSEDPNLRFKRGTLYHRLKNYAFAIRDFDFILENADFSETTAIIFKGIQKNEGGAAEFAGITTIDKLKGDVYHARANAHCQLDHYDKAMKDYSRAINENPNDASYFVNRGLCHLDQRDSTFAKGDFIRALSMQPGMKSALFNLSKLVSAEERENLNKELYADNDVSVIFSQRAYEKYLRGEYTGALLDYDSSLFWMPANAEDLMNRGIVKTKLKKPLSAIEDFERSLKIDESKVRNYVLIANAQQTLRRYSLAIENYQLYLLHGEVDPQVYYNKGIAELKLGHKKEACEDLTLAFNLGEKKAEKPRNQACGSN